MTWLTINADTSSGKPFIGWACMCLPLVVMTLLVAACGPADVGFTFDNRTDTVLCEYPSPQDAAGASCLVALDPRAETKGGRDCDGKGERPVSVIITVKDGGDQIYSRTASCGEWNDTDRRFVIEQDGSSFLVSDSFPDP